MKKMMTLFLFSCCIFLCPKGVWAGDFSLYPYLPNLNQQYTLKAGEEAVFIISAKGTNYVKSSMELVFDEAKLEIVKLEPHTSVFTNAKVGNTQKSPVLIEMGDAKTDGGMDLFTVTFRVKEGSSSPANFKVVNIKDSNGNQMEDFTHDIYFRSPNTANKITSLGVSNGSLVTPFMPETLEYQLKVDPNATHVTFSATGENSLVVLEGLGEVSIEGKDTLYVKAISESGEARVYTFHLLREKDVFNESNTTLRYLIPSAGYLPFEENVLDYKVTVPYGITQFELKATPESSKTTVDIQGQGNLTIGDNHISVVVVAENGTTKTYTIVVTRLEYEGTFSNNNRLKSLNIEGYSLAFRPDQYEYTLVVNNWNTLSIQGIVEHEKAMGVIQGNDRLQEGSEILLIVTAENGENKEYKLRLTMKKEEKAVSGFAILGGTILALEVVSFLVLGYFRFFRRKKDV